MTILNPKLTRLATMDIQLGSGSLTPDATIDDGLLITQDSAMNLDQLELNAQDDVVSPSLGNSATLIGSKGGSATISGNLATFGTQNPKEPSIGKWLEICGTTVDNADSLLFDATPTNVVPGTLIENAGATAQGMVTGIDALTVYFLSTLGTFADADVITVVTAGDAVGTVDTYTADVGSLYRPDSNSTTVGSVYQYKDGTRKAISDCAGNFEVSAESSQFAKFTLSVMGKYDGPNWEDAVTPVITYNDTPAPSLFMNSQMKLTFGGDVFIPINTNVSFNLGATPQLRRNSVDSTGLVGGFISSRSDASASVVIEDEDETTFPYIEYLLSCDGIGTIDWNLSDCNNRPNIFFHQNVNITNASDGDENGIATVTLEMKTIDPNKDDGDCWIMFV